MKRTHMPWSRRAFLSTSGRAAASLVTAGLLPRWQAPRTFGRAVLERTAVAMGTTVSIIAYGESRTHLLEATGQAFAELARLDRLLSVFIPTSDIARLNCADVDEPIVLQESTADVLRAAGRFTELTAGGFDATVGSLLSAWGFHQEAGAASALSGRDVLEAVEGIGWNHIRLASDGTARRLCRGTKIDLGGIGAGYAVDRMGTILRRQGVESALIDHSGDLLAIGAPPESDGWVIALSDPLDPERLLSRRTLRDCAVSTSTNARSVRTVGGRIVGHIIEPRTGENPREHVSVSVVAPTSTEADALSTALFVDAHSGGRWRNGQREAIFVRPDGREYDIESVR